MNLALFGCSRESVIDLDKQYGANPELPEAQNYLVPPMKVPRGVGWAENQKPVVAQGLKLRKLPMAYYIQDSFIPSQMATF